VVVVLFLDMLVVFISEPNEDSELSSQMFCGVELCCGAELSVSWIWGNPFGLMDWGTMETPPA
jgi:hypothetical protein